MSTGTKQAAGSSVSSARSKRLKVYAGCIHDGPRAADDKHVYVAATSQQAVAQIVGESRYIVARYWSVVGEHSPGYQPAMAQPGVVMVEDPPGVMTPLVKPAP